MADSQWLSANSMAVAGSLLVTSCPINTLASTALCSFSLFVDLDDSFLLPCKASWHQQTKFKSKRTQALFHPRGIITSHILTANWQVKEHCIGATPLLVDNPEEMQSATTLPL
jgi:hypothetical protein